MNLRDNICLPFCPPPLLIPRHLFCGSPDSLVSRPLRELPALPVRCGRLLSRRSPVPCSAAGEAQVGEAIQEANGYIEGAGFAEDVVPSWSVFVTLPISLIKLFMDVPDFVTVAPFVISGLKAYGLLVWAALSGREPAKHGWYLLSESK
jgi:hypothetical protein